jgi:hypothetical protein
MTHKRTENTSRVFREVPKDSFVASLFGSETRMLSWCKSCKTHKPTSTEFYLKSKRDRKHPNDVRDICIVCHDTQVEKSRLNKLEEGEHYGTLFVGGEVSSAEN